MTDRIPGKPGQYIAVIATSELEKMQAGVDFVIKLIRADQPTVAGTPYSKAAVLPDDLAAEICPDVEDPTPADAFRGVLNLLDSQNLALKLAKIYTWEQWDANPDDGRRQKQSNAVVIDASNYYADYSYSDGITWTNSGFALVNPTTTGVPTVMDEVAHLPGKYVQRDLSVFYYIPPDAEIFKNGTDWIASEAYRIYPATLLSIVSSTNPYFYPNEGEMDGAWYIASRQRGEDAPAECILYTPQALTEEQKAQVRENIGATEIPAPTADDNGKFLRVVDGAAVWADVADAEEVAF